MIRATDLLRRVGVTAAAEPRSGDWRWVHLCPPDKTEALMRRIQLYCVQKRLAPVKRSVFTSAGPHKQISYALLFKDTADRRRYIMNLYGVAKKLGASPEMLVALDPRVLDRQYISTLRVAPGSEIWKFLVKYGFQTEQAQAAAEPQRLNVESIAHVFHQIKGTVYTTAPSRDFPQTRLYQAAVLNAMTDDRKSIWTRPTLILVTQLQVHDVSNGLISLRGTTPSHAYFDPETNELVVLGQVGSVTPKEIGRKHVTEARAAVKYILQCIIKHDDPLRSWR